jgi:hypothetical protein
MSNENSTTVGYIFVNTLAFRAYFWHLLAEDGFLAKENTPYVRGPLGPNTTKYYFCKAHCEFFGTKFVDDIGDLYYADIDWNLVAEMIANPENWEEHEEEEFPDDLTPEDLHGDPLDRYYSGTGECIGDDSYERYLNR